MPFIDTLMFRLAQEQLASRLCAPRFPTSLCSSHLAQQNSSLGEVAVQPCVGSGQPARDGGSSAKQGQQVQQVQQAGEFQEVELDMASTEKTEFVWVAHACNPSLI